MTQYRVTDENIAKVEAYLIKRVKETGSNRIAEPVVEIADGSGVALATAHKALKQMAQEQTLQIIKPSSRRYPTEYVYKGDIDAFEAVQEEMNQIEYLQELVQKLTAENEDLKGRLAVYENTSRNRKMN